MAALWKSSLLAFTLLSQANAIVYRTHQVLANFDDITSLPETSDSDPKTNIDVYNNLQWHGFRVEAPEDPFADDFVGVPVISEPNYAVSTTPEKIVSVTSAYERSNVAFFDLSTFSWGCISHEKKRQGAPAWCTLEIHGYEPGSRLPTDHSISFFFPSEEEQLGHKEMVTQRIDFSGVNNVLFHLVDGPADARLIIDDVRFTTYNVTAMGHGLSEVIHDETADADTVRSLGESQFPLATGPDLSAFGKPRRAHGVPGLFVW